MRLMLDVLVEIGYVAGAKTPELVAVSPFENESHFIPAMAVLGNAHAGIDLKQEQ